MKLGYNPEMLNDENIESEPLESWVAKPGRYKFTVQSIGDDVSKKGTKGCKAVLIVDDGAPWETKSVLWMSYDHAFGRRMLRKFIEHLGLTYDPPPEDWEVVGKKGEADFEVDEYTDNQGRTWVNLKVGPDGLDVRAPALSSQEQPPLPRPGYEPPSMADDDVPF